MQVQLLLFGITEDIIGEKSMTLELKNQSTVKAFKDLLIKDFPKLEKHKSFSIAVNMEYANDEIILKPNDTLALIPPVSGG